jgi:hypothetical protein
MPFKYERDRVRLHEQNERTRENGNLIEDSFPIRGAGDDGKGINPRHPVQSIDLTGVSLMAFSSVGDLTIA